MFLIISFAIFLFFFFIFTRILGSRCTFLGFIADIFCFFIELSSEIFSSSLSLFFNFRDKFIKEK